MSATALAPTSTLVRPEKGDRVGVWASILCAIHCAVTPVLLLLAPAFGEIWAHPASHWIVALFVVPLALVMLVRGFRVHRKAWIVFSGILGVIMVMIGAIVPYVEEPTPAPKAATNVEEGEVFTWSVGEPFPVDDSSEGSDEVFVWTKGEEMPGLAASDSDAGVCLDACCPSFVTDADGNVSLHIPTASVVTTLGGFALICTHLGNLCACRRIRKQGDCCDSAICAG
ncbi:MAG: MerC domain-containing protein [Verrucomicrobiota bacterium]